MVARANRRFCGISRIAKAAVTFGKMRGIAIGHLKPLMNIGFIAAAIQLSHGIDKLVIKNQPRRTAVLKDELNSSATNASSKAPRPRRFLPACNSP